jgi:glycerol-3-phosphate dehydrogenase
MAEDCVNQAAIFARLPERACTTEHLNIHGHLPNAERYGALSVYGSDAAKIRQLMEADPALGKPLCATLPYTGAEIVWTAREEMAHRLEDVLARRTRALFLNARSTMEMAVPAADLMARELGRPAEWAAAQVAEFREVARRYVA